MNYLFGCFGAKHKSDIQPPTTTREAKVSRNQLSDLFASPELEEISYHEKSAQPESVDIQCCKDKKTNKVVDSNELTDHALTPPAKPSVSTKGLDSQEETPTSCISDPPRASRNSVSTNAKSENGNFSSFIMHPYCTNNESLASEAFSASNNECGSDTSSTLVSSVFPNALASDNRNGFDKPSNQRYPLQKSKNGSASSQKNLQVQGSMSSPRKPAPHKKVGNKVHNQAEVAAYGLAARSPRDRPILRTVTAHWNEEVGPSPVPLKWWDGNGIPNSTNKYREDQIVSWDATPFEERLEKALSEANSISQMKPISGAYDTFEDEIDSAASQLQSMPQSKTVVSF